MQQESKSKIPFDKYYTPPTVARWCIEKAYEVIGRDNISEIIEPSAGCGMFSNQIEGCKAYDLYPQSEYIEQANFLELDLSYKEGRLFIGNPPFGSSSGKLVKQFYNKCCDTGDYIAFILPASFAGNYKRFKRFEIIYSCIIKTDYTNVDLYTSFVIYKRNKLIDRFEDDEIPEIKDVTFYRYTRSNDGKKHSKVKEYDYCFTAFGVIFKESKPYQTVSTIAIKCKNVEDKEKVIRFFKWIYEYNKETKFLDIRFTSNKSLDIGIVKRLFRICLPEIN